jgi:hypothetical protein
MNVLMVLLLGLLRVLLKVSLILQLSLVIDMSQMYL